MKHWIIFLFLLGSKLAAYCVFAQQAVPDKRVVRVGQLTGRIDLREWQLYTSLGKMAVFGAGNGRPFKVVQLSSEEVEIQFLNSVGLEPYNPNTVLFHFYETERALISALILDEVDTAVLESEISALEVKKSNSQFTPVPVRPDSNTVKLIYYNHRNPILRSAKIRMALSFAINHEQIKKDYFQQKATIARGPFDDDSPLYSSGMETYKYHPRKAAQLLEEEGWRDRNSDGILDKGGVSFSLSLYYAQGLRLDESISRQIKIDLLKVGVDINPRPMVKSKLNDVLSSHSYDAVLSDVTFKNSVDALVETFSAGGSRNYMSYVSEDFEELLRFYNQTDKNDIKETLIKSMQKVINQEQPVTFLYFRWLTHYLVNFNKFRNYRDLQGNIRPYENWIIKDLERD